MLDSPLEAEARYQTSLTAVNENLKVWGLRNEVGWANWSGEDGPVIPFWSSKFDAEAGARASFPEYHPESLELDDFREEWLPELSRRGCWIGINLRPDMAGIDLPAEKLLEQLRKIGGEPFSQRSNFNP